MKRQKTLTKITGAILLSLMVIVSVLALSPRVEASKIKDKSDDLVKDKEVVTEIPETPFEVSVGLKDVETKDKTLKKFEREERIDVERFNKDNTKDKEYDLLKLFKSEKKELLVKDKKSDDKDRNIVRLKELKSGSERTTAYTVKKDASLKELVSSKIFELNEKLLKEKTKY